MNPRMTQEAVTELAQEFWNSQAANHLKANGRPWIMEGLKVANIRLERVGRRSHQWIVQFSSKTPDGAVIDSPPFVVVNDETGEAGFAGT